jgi:hypothetical protein
MSLLERAVEVKNEAGLARDAHLEAARAPDSPAIRREAGITALDRGLRGFGDHDAAQAVLVLINTPGSDLGAHFKHFRTVTEDGREVKTQAGLLLERERVSVGDKLFQTQVRTALVDVEIFLGEDGTVKSQYTIPPRDHTGAHSRSLVFDGLGPASSVLVRNLYDRNAHCLESVTSQVTAIAEKGIESASLYAANMKLEAQKILEAKK